MIKKLTCILAISLVCVLAVPQFTDRQIVQQILNGLFQQNKLPRPTTVIQCIDDNTAHQIVVFIGEQLDKAVGNISDVMTMNQTYLDFMDNLDPAVVDCLAKNNQYTTLYEAFGIIGVEKAVLEKKVVTYITLHYLAVHKWFVDVDDTWHKGDYYQVGFKAATYGHIVLGPTAPQLTDQEIVRQLFYGAYDQNKLIQPKTLFQCIDDTTAYQIVFYVRNALDRGANGSLADLASLIQQYNDFIDYLDPAARQCLIQNSQYIALTNAFGITGVDRNVTQQKIISYITLHYLAVHKWFVDLNDNFYASNYYQVGFNISLYGHIALGPTAQPKLTDKQIIQQLLNGLYDQNKLARPTTVVQCIDDISARQIVVYVGDALDKGAKGSLNDLVVLYNQTSDYINNFQPEVVQCLRENGQYIALTDAFGVTGVDSATIEKKVITYLSLHFVTVHKWAVDVDDTWHAGDYYQVGFKAATYGHNILGSSSIKSYLRID